MKKIPEPIAAIIEAEIQKINAERQKEKLAEEKERKELLKRGREYLSNWVKAQLEKVPEYLRPYYERLNTDSTDDDLAITYGQEGEKRNPNSTLLFNVPGLSPLVYEPKNGQWACMKAQYKNDVNDDVEWMDWWNAYLRYERLESVLGQAMLEYERYESLQVQCEERKAIRERAWQEEQVAESAIWMQTKEEKRQEQAEDQELFEAVKDDPVAVHLLKAFLSIRQERSMFEAQVADANNSMYSMDERWSRKAAELRRQADDAQRRAEEERNRASSIEDDLDDAQKKIKKMERGW